MSSKRRKRRAARTARERPERQQDPRLVAARTQKMDGVDLPPGHWVLGVSPVNLDDGRRLMWYPPQAVAFNLAEAKKYRDRGRAKRRNITNSYGPANPRVLGRRLQGAVLSAR